MTKLDIIAATWLFCGVYIALDIEADMIEERRPSRFNLPIALFVVGMGPLGMIFRTLGNLATLLTSNHKGD